MRKTSPHAYRRARMRKRILADEVDHSCIDPGAEERRSRTPDHFDALQVDLTDRHQAIMVQAQRRHGRSPVIRHHIRGAGKDVIESPQHDLMPVDARLRHVHPGYIPKQHGRGRQGDALDFSCIQDGDRGRGVQHLLGGARCAHDHGIEIEACRAQGHIRRERFAGLQGYLHLFLLVSHKTHRNQVISRRNSGNFIRSVGARGGACDHDAIQHQRHIGVLQRKCRRRVRNDAANRHVGLRLRRSGRERTESKKAKQGGCEQIAQHGVLRFDPFDVNYPYWDTLMVKSTLSCNSLPQACKSGCKQSQCFCFRQFRRQAMPETLGRQCKKW